MSNQLPIQFLLHQLTNNKLDRERFNLISSIHCIIGSEETGDKGQIYFGNKQKDIYKMFSSHPDFYQEKIICTCLSRVNGEAVLKVFEGDGNKTKTKYKTDNLYMSFSFVLYLGGSLDIALFALRKTLLELVPEYQEFLNNNNK